MTTAIIITICILVLLAYIFDITSPKTRIPSVILLLILGWTVRQATDFLDIYIPDLTDALPVLGTFGLILIVLEGSLELELNRNKISVLSKSFIVALIPMIVLCFGIAMAVSYMGEYSFKDCLTNAIPLCVISSAIAIPSVKNLTKDKREFIIYESSMSDIIGVILFNFFSLNEIINPSAFYTFFTQFIMIIVISFVTSAILSFLLNKIDHKVKFIPIIFLIILIYAISKIYHLPSLVFIMVFGLFIGNLDEMKNWKWVKFFQPETLNSEIIKFRELTTESAFLVRSLFFMLFGYLIQTEELLDTSSITFALAIVISTILIRAAQLKLSGIKLMPFLFVAPRGLITILLFLSIPMNQIIPIFNNSLIIQVIVLLALFMMIGLMFDKKEPEVEIPTAD